MKRLSILYSLIVIVFTFVITSPAYTKEEFEGAYIITSVNIPEKSFEKLTPELIKDKNTLFRLEKG